MTTSVVKNTLAAILLLLLLAAVVYSLQPRAAATDTPGQTASSVAAGSTKGIALVESSRIVRGTLEPLFSSLGTIEALQRAELFSPVNGLLSELRVAPGDRVEADTVVAVITTEALAAELKETEAEQALLPDSPATDSTVQARRDYLTARAARLRQTISAATLRAPIAGTVTGICCSAGQRVVGYEAATATPLLVIENFEQVYAQATIPERFISQVTIDMPARTRVGAYPLEYFPLAIFSGKVISISPTVDPQTRTFDIRVLLDNADGRLRSGMSVEVGLIMEHYEKVLLVAKEAVVKGELQSGLDLVFVIEDAEKAAAGEPVPVSARAVDLGPGDGANYIINEKIDAAGGREKLATALLGRDLEGSLVVTVGAASLVDGQLVKVVR